MRDGSWDETPMWNLVSEKENQEAFYPSSIYE